LSSGEEHNIKYRDVVKGEMASFDISTKNKRKTKGMEKIYLGILILQIFLILLKIKFFESQIFLDVSPSDPSRSLLYI